MSEIPNQGGQGKTQPTGRGVPIGNMQAPSGLSGPGRGVGIPNLMTMMPTMGRGATPISQPRMQMNPQNMNIQMGGMIRPPTMNPMMIRPPQGGNQN